MVKENELIKTVTTFTHNFLYYYEDGGTDGKGQAGKSVIVRQKVDWLNRFFLRPIGFKI